MESSFGEKLIVKISGGSHEPSVNVSITGLPQGFTPDMEVLQAFLDRRSPGKSNLASSRKEADVPLLKSDSRPLSGPRIMHFEIANIDHRSGDYDKFRYIPRPGHADYTAWVRYGDSLNMAGGGPFSGRMTVGLCVAGGLALQVLAERGISVRAQLVSAGGADGTDSAIRAAIEAARDSGDSVGGIVQCIAEGVPAGIGDAMYGGIESRLSPVLFGIPAVKGVEFGTGFGAAGMKGSENNDPYYCADSLIRTRTNNCGGILGGITTGMPLTCRVAFKPTPSISIPQESVDLRTGETVELSVDGRHDPCVALRAVPVVEAAVALGLLDAIMVTEGAKANNLQGFRQEIDCIDSQLLSLFEKRMELAGEIGKIKKINNLPVVNASREEEILDKIRSMSRTDFAPYSERLFRNIFSLSKELQRTGRFGLIGHPLGHSFSPQVHEAFGAYRFELFDLTFEEMKAFVSDRNFHGLTVTKPYKQDVIPLCDRLTDRAKAIGAVNTLYFEGDELIGHNTDYDGFLYTADRSGIDFADKTVLILGTGGTSKTVNFSVRDRGACCVYFASRNGATCNPNTCNADSNVLSYESLNLIAYEIDIIVNTTPAGTYPDNLNKLICLKDFPKCRAVIDVIYNPSMTPLLMEADAMGLKWANGMPMIVAQAAAAADRFMGYASSDYSLISEYTFTNQIEDVLRKIESDAQNIVLIGMPGCGKSTLGRKLAELTGRKFVDLDEEIVSSQDRSIPEIFDTDGERFFRSLETAAAEKFGAEHGQIIATGGGVVLNERNYLALKQNGFIIWLTRPLDELSLEGRPLSESREAVRKLYDERCELYSKWADLIVKKQGH